MKKQHLIYSCLFTIVVMIATCVVTVRVCEIQTNTLIEEARMDHIQVKRLTPKQFYGLVEAYNAAYGTTDTAPEGITPEDLMLAEEDGVYATREHEVHVSVDERAYILMAQLRLNKNDQDIERLTYDVKESHRRVDAIVTVCEGLQRRIEKLAMGVDEVYGGHIERLTSNDEKLQVSIDMLLAGGGGLQARVDQLEADIDALRRK